MKHKRRAPAVTQRMAVVEQKNPCLLRRLGVFLRREWTCIRVELLITTFVLVAAWMPSIDEEINRC